MTPSKQSEHVLCWEDLSIFKHENGAFSVECCFQVTLELMWLAGELSDESTQAGDDEWRLHWHFPLNVCTVSQLCFRKAVILQALFVVSAVS